jgi:hypothetical protein
MKVLPFVALACRTPALPLLGLGSWCEDDVVFVRRPHGCCREMSRGLPASLAKLARCRWVLRRRSVRVNFVAQVVEQIEARCRQGQEHC